MTDIDTRYMRDPRKLRAFAAHYVGDCHFNATKAARAVGVSEASAGQQGYLWLKHSEVKKMIDDKLAEVHMSADEALAGLAEIGRGNLGEFYKVEDTWLSNPPAYCEILEEKEVVDKTNPKKHIKRTLYHVRYMALDTDKLADPQYSHLLQEFSQSRTRTKLKMYSKVDAYDKVLRIHGKYVDHVDLTSKGEKLSAPIVNIYIPDNKRDSND